MFRRSGIVVGGRASGAAGEGEMNDGLFSERDGEEGEQLFPRPQMSLALGPLETEHKIYITLVLLSRDLKECANVMHYGMRLRTSLWVWTVD